jgi:hypothetical protein
MVGHGLKFDFSNDYFKTSPKKNSKDPTSGCFKEKLGVSKANLVSHINRIPGTAPQKINDTISTDSEVPFQQKKVKEALPH